MNKIFLEFLRWNLRFHGLFHLAHIIQDILGPATPNWGGVILHLYIIFIEILASFFTFQNITFISNLSNLKYMRNVQIK